MNNISKSLLVTLLLLQPSFVHAEDLKTVVSEFEAPAADNELGKRMGIVCSEEVMQAKGFRYVSPTEFVKLVTGDEKLVVDKTVDLEKEFSENNKKYLEEISRPYQKDSFDNLFKALEVTDVVMGGRLERSGSTIKAELMMHGSKNQKDYDVTIECEEGLLETKVREKVKELLKNIAKPVKIYADKLLDAKDSRVMYLVKAEEGVGLNIEMDYTGDRPDPQIQNVSILPPDDVDKSGTATYRIKAEEGRSITVDFSFKNRELDSVKVDTPMPDPSKNTEQSETLTLKSRAGYALKFEFLWDKGEMKHAKLYPALNPFGEYD